MVKKGEKANKMNMALIKGGLDAGRGAPAIARMLNLSVSSVSKALERLKAGVSGRKECAGKKKSKSIRLSS